MWPACQPARYINIHILRPICLFITPPPYAANSFAYYAFTTDFARYAHAAWRHYTHLAEGKTTIRMMR